MLRIGNVPFEATLAANKVTLDACYRFPRGEIKDLNADVAFAHVRFLVLYTTGIFNNTFVNFA